MKPGIEPVLKQSATIYNSAPLSPTCATTPSACSTQRQSWPEMIAKNEVHAVGAIYDLATEKLTLVQRKFDHHAHGAIHDGGLLRAD